MCHIHFFGFVSDTTQPYKTTEARRKPQTGLWIIENGSQTNLRQKNPSESKESIGHRFHTMTHHVTRQYDVKNMVVTLANVALLQLTQKRKKLIKPQSAWASQRHGTG